jgi:C-terminal processing protease CtpA/Prc
MIVIKKENKFIIKQVIENTPASEVGLKEKDELIKINGKPASNYTLSEITKLLKGNAGERIDLVIKRGRKKMEFSLILREYIK